MRILSVKSLKAIISYVLVWKLSWNDCGNEETEQYQMTLDDFEV